MAATIPLMVAGCTSLSSATKGKQRVCFGPLRPIVYVRYENLYGMTLRIEETKYVQTDCEYL